MRTLYFKYITMEKIIILTICILFFSCSENKMIKNEKEYFNETSTSISFTVFSKYSRRQSSLSITSDSVLYNEKAAYSKNREEIIYPLLNKVFFVQKDTYKDILKYFLDKDLNNKRISQDSCLKLMHCDAINIHAVNDKHLFNLIIDNKSNAMLYVGLILILERSPSYKTYKTDYDELIKWINRMFITNKLYDDELNKIKLDSLKKLYNAL
jgi:hypothetical protein